MIATNHAQSEPTPPRSRGKFGDCSTHLRLLLSLQSARRGKLHFDVELFDGVAVAAAPVSKVAKRADRQRCVKTKGLGAEPGVASGDARMDDSMRRLHVKHGIRTDQKIKVFWRAKLVRRGARRMRLLSKLVSC